MRKSPSQSLLTPLLGPLELPIIKFQALYHVGEKVLGPNQNGYMEGYLFSVSNCPEAWKEIARLGNAPLWEIPNLTLVDVHAISNKKKQHILQTAEALGLCTPKSFWKAWGTNECGEDTYTVCNTKTEAKIETQEGCKAPTVYHTHDASPTLQNFWLQRAEPACRPHIWHPDYTLLALLSHQLQNSCVDGLWLGDTFDPVGYSAPRGGLWPKLSETAYKVTEPNEKFVID
jgi:hypothetical protein